MRAKEAKRLLKTASPTLESGWTNQPEQVGARVKNEELFAQSG
jgi:hypothetical protein